MANMWNIEMMPRKGDQIFSTKLLSIAGDVDICNLVSQTNSSWAVWLSILCIFSFFHGLIGLINLTLGGNSPEDEVSVLRRDQMYRRFENSGGELLTVLNDSFLLAGAL